MKTQEVIVPKGFFDYVQEISELSKLQNALYGSLTRTAITIAEKLERNLNLANESVCLLRCEVENENLPLLEYLCWVGTEQNILKHEKLPFFHQLKIRIDPECLISKMSKKEIINCFDNMAKQTNNAVLIELDEFSLNNSIIVVRACWDFRA